MASLLGCVRAEVCQRNCAAKLTDGIALYDSELELLCEPRR